MALAAIFPTLLFLSLGYIAKQTKLFHPKRSKVFVDFIIYIALPSLIIDLIYHIEIKKELLYYIAVGYISIVFTYLLVKILSKLFAFDPINESTILMMTLFGNTTFMGLPIIDGFYGKEGVSAAIFYDQFVVGIPVILLGPFIIANARKIEGAGVDIKKILLFPPLLALFVGFLCKTITLPDFLLGSLHTLGATVTPLAIFTLGLQLSFSDIIGQRRMVSLVLFLKMIFVPLVLIFAIKSYIGEFNVGWKAIFMEMAMPPMVTAMIMVLKANLNNSLAIASLGGGVILSILTLPILFAYIL